MRSKGLLVWNTITQFETAYVVFVDAIALDAIGMSLKGEQADNRLQILCRLHAVDHHSVCSRLVL